MASIPPEYQPELERIVQKRLAEQADAFKIAAIDKQIASFARQVAGNARAIRDVAKRLDGIEKRLEENNHLRRDLATKEYIDEKLASVVVVRQIGDGDYTVTLGDVTLGPEDLDELPEVTRASRAARAAAASAHQAAARADQSVTTRSIWLTAIATALSALVSTAAALAALYVYIRVHGG